MPAVWRHQISVTIEFLVLIFVRKSADRQLVGVGSLIPSCCLAQGVNLGHQIGGKCLYSLNPLASSPLPDFNNGQDKLHENQEGLKGEAGALLLSCGY